ncbi:MAG: hypothetical protein WBG86_09805 [Polyangiales bacterium]
MGDAPKPKAVVSWSSGKDSAYALHVARQAGELDVVGALTTVTEAFGRVSMHGVREEILDRQMIEIGLTCRRVSLPWPCTNEIYEQRMGAAISELQDSGVTHVIFGDLFLEDLRAYREANLARVGMHAVFPLWKQSTPPLAREMIAKGLRATLACVDPKVLDRSFAGRAYDDSLLTDLPDNVDPCGENGEFHTVVTAGPAFARPIATRVGEVVERSGFVYADVLLADA